MGFAEEKPIYLQISEKIEDAILSGAFEENTQVPSTTEISVNYKINPATALKGISLLVEEGIVYKKRGLGMFVAPGAKERIEKKRRNNFYDSYVRTLVSEAKKLGLNKKDLLEQIERGFDDE
ncbi:GntR family transcriptional regulator [Caproiciproducens sp. LBM24188]|nr:GntR family transcriptional regulator [Oscillospiraceae bacterium]